ncbi:hypothetical protein K1719_034741 [Acacia pycnantha]|nr:hypothetical protein K1719_034741 [Acacia pycnantha]
MVQSLKEIVSNFPEHEIYAMLKECDMDPNEAVSRLLSQDPFHEVKSKREKKKEVCLYSNLHDVCPPLLFRVDAKRKKRFWSPAGKACVQEGKWSKCSRRADKLQVLNQFLVLRQRTQRKTLI